MLPDVQAQNGNALHLGNALHNMPCIGHMGIGRRPPYVLLLSDCRGNAAITVEFTVDSC